MKPEPSIGQTIRVCETRFYKAVISDPAEVTDRIGPNFFALRRAVKGGWLNWCERVTSWVVVRGDHANHAEVVNGQNHTSVVST